MPAVMKSWTLSVSIERPPAEVYAFASNPENLPRWAKGLCRSVERSGDDWTVETPAGPMRVRFVAQNEFGVLDHIVTVAPGREVLNPMRVIPNGAGSEVLFTLFQSREVSDAQFAEDARLVEADLHTLTTVLEQSSHHAPA